ncbi:MAG: substrate-binding domain-containing protein [Methanobacteriaceae archaeon]|jgi:tungstate transport system substrate-binding protein
MKDKTIVIITILIVLVAGIGVYAQTFLNRSNGFGAGGPAAREVVLNEPQTNNATDGNETQNAVNNTTDILRPGIGTLPVETRNAIIDELRRRAGIGVGPQVPGIGVGPQVPGNDTPENVTRRLRISTTTSLFDTGLLDAMEDAFEKRHPNVDVHIVSGGTGIALARGARGDADLVIVHDRTRELAFVANGSGTSRTEFSFNHFWVVGPAGDPANIRGLVGAGSGFRRIRDAGRLNLPGAPRTDPNTTRFISRGDASGTHSREQSIWRGIGENPALIRNETIWYLESGTGMRDTLVIANYFGAYTLTDSGTFLAHGGNLRQKITTGGDLLNVYTAIPVCPVRHNHTNIEDAHAFVAFLVSAEGQGIINNFGRAQFGEPLFRPLPIPTA